MNNNPINPNDRKAQKRDSKNIDADKIENLTLGELQESLINSTLRVKNLEEFSPNYGLAKASCYSLLSYGNPTTPEEVVSQKENINNWLDYQYKLNTDEPYGYLTFGAFKQWARAVINMVGKSGDSQSIDLYFCNSDGEKIDTTSKGPLFEGDKYYFKFYQKNFDQVSQGDYSLLTPTINDLKGQNYNITLENQEEHLYSISINVLQYQPTSTQIQLKLIYQEADYESQASLTIEIPEWSILLLSPGREYTIEGTYFTPSETNLIQLQENSGEQTFFFVVLHYCYYYQPLINKGDWLIEPQKLASGEVDYISGIIIDSSENSSIFGDQGSWVVYKLTAQYNNLYSQRLTQVLSIEVSDLFNFNIAFSIKETSEQLKVVSCGTRNWRSEDIKDLVIGSGPSAIVIGKEETITISNAIYQPFNIGVKLNYIQSDTLEDQYVNCYGSSEDNTSYLKVGLDQPISSFVSLDLEEGDPTIYTLEDIQIVSLNTSSTPIGVPIYLVRLTADEDKEFRETSEELDLYQWIYRRKKKTEFPVFKVTFKIQSLSWSAYVNYPINGSLLKPLPSEGQDYLFQLIPESNISEDGVYQFSFRLTTTNVVAEEEGIDQGTPEEYNIITPTYNGPFSEIQLTRNNAKVENKQNIYDINVKAKVNPEKFFQDNYIDHQDVVIVFNHSTGGSSNSIAFRVLPKDLIITKPTSNTYRYINVSKNFENQELISFVDCITKSHQEKTFSTINVSYEDSFQIQPVGCQDLSGLGTLDGLSLPNNINEGAFNHDNDYFHGLFELGIHLNTTTDIRMYISTRFDDYLNGVYINRSEGVVPSPDYSWGEDNSSILFRSWVILHSFGPIYKRNLVNGKNTIEFLVYNPKNHGFFQAAITLGGSITRDNYNSTWGYKNDLTK